MAMRPTPRPFQVEFEGQFYAATFIASEGAVTITWFPLGASKPKVRSTHTVGDGQEEAQRLLRELLLQAKVNGEL